MFSVLKSNLAKRILLLVSVSILLMLVAFILSGWLAITQSSEQTLRERQDLAQAISRHLDYILAENLEKLENFRFAPGVNLEDSNIEPEESALHELFIQSDFDEGVFITDVNGSVLWVEPSGSEFVGLNIADRAPVKQTLNSARTSVSGPLADELLGKRSIFVITPVHNQEGGMVGLVGGMISPSGRVLSDITSWVSLDDSEYIAVLDDAGNPIAISAGFDGPDVVPVRSGATIQASLSYAPWSVVIHQPEANAPVRDMGLRLAAFGVLSILIVLGLSWGMTRSILQPLAQLRDAAQNIARGELSKPIPHTNNDEIGQLGSSFDAMRIELKKSLQEIQRWNQDLESKVQQRTRQLEDSYREIERKEAARGELLRKLFSVQEEERRRIARELHDETSQSLNSLVMRVEAALATPDDSAKRIKEILVDTRNLAVHTIDSVHKIIFDLRPSVLDDLGLISALRWYAQNRLKQKGVNVRVEVTGEETKLPAAAENAIFRVVQEAVNNIVRHAEAQNALLSIEFNEKTVNIEIEDDGRGFVVNEFDLRSNKLQGLGLAGMAERMSLIGGTLKIESQPGAGTHIYISIPL